MPSLKITAAPEEILETQNYRRYIKKFLRYIVQLVQKALGANILVEIPEKLQDKNIEIYDAIAIAHKLQAAGVMGGVKKFPKLPDEPCLFRYISSPAGIHAAGSDFLSERAAFYKMLGESAERYLWRNSNSFYRDKLIRSSERKLGGQTLDLSTLAGFSQAQKEKNECLQFDKNTVFGWIPVESLISGKKTYSPAQLFSARYFSEKAKLPTCANKAEPMLRWCITTGLAAGPSLPQALAKGVLEVIERDAFMITYLNKISPPVADQENLSEQDAGLARIIRQMKRYLLNLYILKLPTDFKIEVFAAVLIDTTGKGPAFTIGASADFDAKECILDAISEALAVRMSVKNTYQQPLNPGRLGRMGRILYWTKKENLEKIKFLHSGEKRNIDLGSGRNIFAGKNKPENVKKEWEKNLRNLISQLKRKKYEAVFAGLTTKEILDIGFRCVKVVIPELQPMHLEEILPYHGGKRLHEVPEKLGYQPASELNKEPHPFP